MLTGEVIHKFAGHTSEISSIDFDGVNFVSGAADGLVNVYELLHNSASSSSPSSPGTVGNAMGRTQFALQLHTRAVSAVKIVKRCCRHVSIIVTWHMLITVIRSHVKAEVWADGADADWQSDLAVTCSMDRTLVATDLVSGRAVWKVSLSSAPLCMDVTPDVGYLGIGSTNKIIKIYMLIC